MMKRTLVISALWTLGIGTAFLPSLGCGSGTPREESGAASKPPPPPPAEEKAPASPGPQPAPPAGKAPAETATAPGGGQPTPESAGNAPGKATEGAVPAVSRPAEVSRDPARSAGAEPPPAAPGGPEQILPTTRRSAAGLPETIAGYISWFRLGPSAAPAEAGKAHAPARQAYVVFPKQENHELGGTVKPPFETDTIIVLEEKEPGKDFISRVRTMTREEKGWKFADYGRDAGDRAFTARTGAEGECAACHAKAKDSDSVHSSLKLE